MKCLMLLATLNQRSGNIVKAIEFVIKAGDMLYEGEKYLSWKEYVYQDFFPRFTEARTLLKRLVNIW